MNKVSKEIMSYYGIAEKNNKDIEHVGVSKRDGAPGRGSGRFELGSGENPYQHSLSFLGRIDELKKQGYSEKDIAEHFKTNTSKLRVQKSMAREIVRSEDVATAKRLKAKGWSNTAIAKHMGFNNESSVRSLLNVDSEARMNEAKDTAEFLKKQIAEKGLIDVGRGIERELGISEVRLKQALYRLETEGYKVFGAGISQPTNPGQQTNLKVVGPPGTEHKDVYNYENIHTITDYRSNDDGKTFDPKWVYPESMSSKRLQINYKEDGGIEKDGLIELRRGVQDLDLGNSTYAQARILVDGTHYIKGMAVYADDLPDGVDVRFNTNKSKGTPVLGEKDNTVLKNISKKDPNNPFGSLIKPGVNDPDNPEVENGGQSYYIDKNGKKKLSLINKRAEEGDWSDWSDKLPSQFLSKQPLKLINQQLELTKADKMEEFESLKKFTNPTIKKKLLMAFADDCDAASVHLKAASLPRQHYRVLIPIPELKDTEVYAPTYKNGEKVALIRYPHGGTFEIPILTVNNKNPKAKKTLGNAKDAVGINMNVAERLSGADFDGDAVTVIPVNRKADVLSTKPLEGLKGFDPKMEYPYREGMKRMENTQNEMGKISNLITDMTLLGATESELARAVRHSMVVIDAEKHGLNYKQSEKDNDIDALKRKYQKHINDDGYGGSATLISRAKSPIQVPKRKGSAQYNKDTGEKYYKEVEEFYVDKNGKTQQRLIDSTKMAEAKDARELISVLDTPTERAYAAYANSMKTLANKARLESMKTKENKRSSTAVKTYAKEVASIDEKLNRAELNRPKERQATIIANIKIKALKEQNPELNTDKKELKKVRQRAMTEARALVGADSKGSKIHLTDKEWEAIQAGAVSPTKLRTIYDDSDKEEIKKLAMPKTSNTLSKVKVSMIKAMDNSGYTIAEIAQRLGVSEATVTKYM